MAKWPINSIGVALYDEPWRWKAFDKLGIRVRVTRIMRYSSGPVSKHRDYYPSLGLLKMLPELAWNYYFMAFDMSGKVRLSIRRRPPARFGHYAVDPGDEFPTGIYVTMPYEEAQQKGYVL